MGEWSGAVGTPHPLDDQPVVSPLPQRGRFREYAAKGAHLALRQVSLAPEQVRARHLASQVEERSNRSGKVEVPGPSKRVAVLTPRDWAAHVQWDSMVGQALRLRGADVRYITCGGDLAICDRANTWEAPPMPCRSCRHYVESSISAHGFEPLRIRDGWASDDPGDWPELDEMGVDELAAVEWEGLPLGRLVEIPTKWFLMASTLDNDPLFPLTLRRFLRSGRRVARGLQAALSSIEPNVVVMLNGLFFFEGICRELCRQRGIEVVVYERGFIRETLLYRGGGQAPVLDMPEAWAAWRDVPLTDAEGERLAGYLDEREHGRRTIDQYWTAPVFQTPLRGTSGRLVTLFTNVTWDSAVIGREVAFPRIQDWLVATVQAFADRPEHELIIRVHPAEVKLPGKLTREPIGTFVTERFPVLPSNVRMIAAEDNRSSYPIMRASDVGLVFTSTAGLEMAILGKPVIVAGDTHYRGKGFTIDVSSPTEYLAALDGTLSGPGSVAPDVGLARRYGYLFFFRAPVGSPGVEEHVRGLARLTVHDLDDLRPGRDESLDRICDGILMGVGFVPRR